MVPARKKNKWWELLYWTPYQQHVRFMYNDGYKGCAIARMKPSQCIVNYPLECPSVGRKNTGNIVRHLPVDDKNRNVNNDLIASLQTNDVLVWGDACK